jgi:hypothetical protein
VGTQFCYSEAIVDVCSNCNATTCSGQPKNCFTGPNTIGASTGSACSSPASYDIQSVSYSIIPDGNGETCDEMLCCCLRGTFIATRTPVGSLTMHLSGYLFGQCGRLQLPMTLNLTMGGQSYAIASDFLNMGPTVIEANTELMTFIPVKHSKCFMAAQAVGDRNVVATVIGSCSPDRLLLDQLLIHVVFRYCFWCYLHCGTYWNDCILDPPLPET